MQQSRTAKWKADRRSALKSLAAGAGLFACGRQSAMADVEHMPRYVGKAEHVISIWLGGGMGQIDSFDPKRQGDPLAKQAGAYYRSIPTAVDQVRVCEHLPRLARQMERVTALRTIHHDVIDEHAAAVNRMHTGRPVSATLVYPSMGSIVANQLGAANEGVPAYVVIGYPNVTRGPGFLGAGSGYLYLTDTRKGPAGLSPAQDLDQERLARRRKFLANVSDHAPAADAKIRDYQRAVQQSLQLGGDAFQRVFELDREPHSLRESYGGEFGQRCLLSRRLIERGVRFVEVAHNLNFLNGSGWDVHNEGILQQHALIGELDQAVSTLILDLERKRLLEKTLIVISTEFGRPPEFDSGGGRGHQGSAFTCVVAGGGLNHCGAYGVTDELSKTIVESPVGVPDFFATVFAALGIDYGKNLYDGDRPVPITDGGKPIARLFS
ncbi:MAG: DUF1501 domain-containing protein [bacterium]|nr:DUF1501 domain-containing protein [bacterium]